MAATLPTELHRPHHLVTSVSTPYAKQHKIQSKKNKRIACYIIIGAGTIGTLYYLSKFSNVQSSKKPPVSLHNSDEKIRSAYSLTSKNPIRLTDCAMENSPIPTSTISPAQLIAQSINFMRSTNQGKPNFNFAINFQHRMKYNSTSIFDAIFAFSTRNTAFLEAGEGSLEENAFKVHVISSFDGSSLLTHRTFIPDFFVKGNMSREFGLRLSSDGNYLVVLQKIYASPNWHHTIGVFELKNSFNNKAVITHTYNKSPFEKYSLGSGPGIQFNNDNTQLLVPEEAHCSFAVYNLKTRKKIRSVICKIPLSTNSAEIFSWSAPQNIILASNLLSQDLYCCDAASGTVLAHIHMKHNIAATKTDHQGNFIVYTDNQWHLTQYTRDNNNPFKFTPLLNMKDCTPENIVFFDNFVLNIDQYEKSVTEYEYSYDQLDKALIIGIEV